MLLTLTLATALAQDPDTACQQPTVTLTAAQMQALLPDPTTASLQSLILGFGTGHFYAGQKSEGLLFASTQVLGLGLAGIAMLNADDIDPENARLLTGMGMTIFGASRVGDFAVVPYSVRKAQRRMVTAEVRQ